MATYSNGLSCNFTRFGFYKLYLLIGFTMMSKQTFCKIFRQLYDSIMLVEPGMLLIYRSAKTRPSLTDMLVEFLDNFARGYEP